MELQDHLLVPEICNRCHENRTYLPMKDLSNVASVESGERKTAVQILRDGMIFAMVPERTEKPSGSG